jgi:Flp pilus assembly pilin Flp
MDSLIWRLTREEEGQDLVEYAFLLVFVALIVAAVLTLTGGGVTSVYQGVNSDINAS